MHSNYYIHQVTTKGKFYIRLNTTTDQFRPQELLEHDIALRYENRFKNKQVQENIFNIKEEEIKESMNYNSYFFIGSVPQIRVSSEEVSKKLFEELLYEKDRTTIYNHLSQIPSINMPKGDGRYIRHEGEYFEINKDKTAFYTYPIKNRAGSVMIGMYEIQNIIDFLSLVSRMYSQIDPFVSITVIIKICNIKNSKLHLDNETPDNFTITKNTIKIRRDINLIPFDVKEHAASIFKEFCENAGMDDVLKVRKGDVETIGRYIDTIEKKIDIDRKL